MNHRIRTLSYRSLRPLGGVQKFQPLFRTIMRPIPDDQLASILTYLESEDNFVFLETSKNSAREQTSFIFHKPLTLLAFHRDDSLEHFFGQAGGYL
ncbi:MAG: hypothetical protein GXP59_08495, partial [Deltaproteobacteria bacterium]|nr:hypothetical protein [Deltaproteobacteria bacterium]